MDEFLKMDIFFAVSTIAVVILTVLAAFVLVSLLRILRKVEEISEMVSEEGKELRADIHEVRAEIAQKGLIAAAAYGVARAFGAKRRKKGS